MVYLLLSTSGTARRLEKSLKELFGAFAYWLLTTLPSVAEPSLAWGLLRFAFSFGTLYLGWSLIRWGNSPPTQTRTLSLEFTWHLLAAPDSSLGCHLPSSPAPLGYSQVDKSKASYCLLGHVQSRRQIPLQPLVLLTCGKQTPQLVKL